MATFLKTNKYGLAFSHKTGMDESLGVLTIGSHKIVRARPSFSALPAVVLHRLTVLKLLLRRIVAVFRCAALERIRDFATGRLYHASQLCIPS